MVSPDLVVLLLLGVLALSAIGGCGTRKKQAERRIVQVTIDGEFHNWDTDCDGTHFGPPFTLHLFASQTDLGLVDAPATRWDTPPTGRPLGFFGKMQCRGTLNLVGVDPGAYEFDSERDVKGSCWYWHGAPPAWDKIDTLEIPNWAPDGPGEPSPTEDPNPKNNHIFHIDAPGLPCSQLDEVASCDGEYVYFYRVYRQRWRARRPGSTEWANVTINEDGYYYWRCVQLLELHQNGVWVRHKDGDPQWNFLGSVAQEPQVPAAPPGTPY